MTIFEKNLETIDNCPACGDLRVDVEYGRTIARTLASGAVCRHTFQEREALRAKRLQGAAARQTGALVGALVGAR
jgi:hypothetical protein